MKTNNVIFRYSPSGGKHGWIKDIKVALLYQRKELRRRNYYVKVVLRTSGSSCETEANYMAPLSVGHEKVMRIIFSAQLRWVTAVHHYHKTHHALSEK